MATHPCRLDLFVLACREPVLDHACAQVRWDKNACCVALAHECLVVCWCAFENVDHACCVALAHACLVVCWCSFETAEFLFGTFCLALTQAVQVKMFPNEIDEHVLLRLSFVI